MLFNSFIFLYGFLPVVYLVFWRLKSKSSRYIWLTAASYVFYGYWNWKFCFWMALSTLISFGAGRGLARFEDKARRRLCVVVPVTLDLLILGIFKYTNFLLQSAGRLLQAFHAPASVPMVDILLPIGISFYTFHTISYMVDCYRRQVKPTANFWEFACYVSLFSQLVAGPIVRFRQVENDLEHLGRASQPAGLNIGWSFFTIGMVKKLLIADTIASFINPGFLNTLSLSSASAWLCVLGYTYQLYFDFSGYSDMAVGLGYLFGIRLPQNFNSPYKAASPADFWRRWHMSLSACLRDYLYIPLGGNRGPGWFIARNLMITMLLGGLWHGAQWTFVLWGAYHGLWLTVLRFYGGGWDRLPLPLRQAATFLIVVVGWVFFRAPSFPTALHLLRALFSVQPGIALTGAGSLTAMLLPAALLAHLGPNTFEMRHDWRPWQSGALTLLLGMCLFTLYASQRSPFLYFQF